MTEAIPVPLVEKSTPRQLVLWAAQCFKDANLFYGHGTDNPHDEAIYLVLRALGLEFDVGEAALDQSLSDAARQQVVELVDKRIQTRTPVAYLVNEAWFFGLAFYVDERVLIPRSPIAELIEQGFSPWLDSSTVKRILDMGTGSACIAIACAVAFPDTSVDAVDSSHAALDVARKNVHRHDLSERIRLIQSDLFEALDGEQYDLIVANLPYVGENELAELPQEYRHEPESGLKAGDTGLEIVKRLLQQAKDHLNADGLLVVEVGNSQQALVNAYPDMPFLWIDFIHGGEGVFIMSRDELVRLQGDNVDRISKTHVMNDYKRET